MPIKEETQGTFPMQGILFAPCLILKTRRNEDGNIASWCFVLSNLRVPFLYCFDTRAQDTGPEEFNLGDHEDCGRFDGRHAINIDRVPHNNKVLGV